MCERLSSIDGHVFLQDKWIEYDCIFSSDVDEHHGRQRNQLELHSKGNLHEPNGKIVDLTKLQSLTCQHGDTTKKEPHDIIILRIDGKRHRLGFDNIFEYNQFKVLLDGVYNSVWDMTSRHHVEENTTVNMLYESVTGMTITKRKVIRRDFSLVLASRYRVYFADLATQELLALPNGECELIFDVDKFVLEQRGDKQYTFARSTIRTISLVTNNEIEFELGSRAPVQGLIKFRFDSPIDARTCYLHWNEGVTPLETSSRESSGRYSLKLTPHTSDRNEFQQQIDIKICLSGYFRTYSSTTDSHGSRTKSSTTTTSTKKSLAKYGIFIRWKSLVESFALIFQKLPTITVIPIQHHLHPLDLKIPMRHSKHSSNRLFLRAKSNNKHNP